MAEQKEINLSELTHFLPRQLEATRAADKHQYTLYGGSAGPGKSYWLRWYPIRQMMRWGQQYGLTGIHGALFSQDFPTLKDRQMSKMEVEFPLWLGEIKNDKAQGLGFHLRKQYGGHVLALRNLDDPSKYLSTEFAIIAVEELTENDEDTFNKLRSRMRWTGIPDPKFIAATNPGGKGHAFVKKLWLDRDFPDELKRDAKEFVYVKALPTDNPYLAASYLRTLDTLPEKLRKAYRDGNWDVFEGQYFAEWDKQQHTYNHAMKFPNGLPVAWPKFRSIDISGREGITSCHWYTLDSDGRVWVYKEYYWGPNVPGCNGGRDYDQHADAIAAMSWDADGNTEDYRYTVIDSSAFTKGGYSETAAQVFERHGVTGLIPSAKERIVGWNAVHTYLRWNLSTRPKLLVSDTCVNMIRTIPLLQHDDKHPDDVDSDGEDHAADELRYFLRTLGESKAPRAETMIERKMRQFKERENSPNYSYSRNQ